MLTKSTIAVKIARIYGGRFLGGAEDFDMAVFVEGADEVVGVITISLCLLSRRICSRWQAL
jgi:hypothetical protein